MAEIVPASHHDEAPKKKSMNKKQKMLLFGGGAVVIVALLFMKRGGGSRSYEQPDDYYTNYPTLGPEAGLFEDQMNTLVGHQEEMMNSFLEMSGKKEPEYGTKIYSMYEDLAGARKMQNWLASNGAESTYIRKEYREDGWLGARDYYTVEAYGRDKDQMATLATDGITEDLWSAVEVNTVKWKDAPKVGTHSRDSN